MSDLFRIDLLTRSISLFLHFILKVNNEISHEENLYAKENMVNKSQDTIAPLEHRYAPTVKSWVS